jgi:hypothetical protein
MNLKTASLKVSGGLFALALVGAAFSAQAPVASAGTCPSPPCFTQYEPGGIVNALRADLTIKNFNAVVDNGTADVTFHIKNQGASAADHFQVKVLINGAVAGTHTWVTVAAGDTVGESFFNLPIPAGTKLVNVQVIVDSGNVVAESNEMNNTVVKSIFLP